MNDDGTAMLLVLIVLTLFLLLSSIAAGLTLQQRRHLVAASHHAQARHAAEAAIALAIHRLERDPTWRALDLVLPITEGVEAAVSVDSYGGFYLVESRAAFRGRTAALRATVGERHPLDAFAVVVGDAETPLHVAGETMLSGDVIVGPRGILRGMVGGRPFRGRIQGTVSTDDDPLPRFDATLIDSELARLDAMMASHPPDAVRIDSGLVPESRVLYAAGSLRLTGDESVHWMEGITVLAGGDLRLDDGFVAPQGARLAATGTVRIGAGVGEHIGLVYAGRTIIVEAGARTSGQLISRDSIGVRARGYLLYPSLLIVTGRQVGTERHGRINVADGATVDGAIVYSSPAGIAAAERGRIVIEPRALVRGALYSSAQTELRGTVHGSVLTHQFYHFASPRGLVNWLVDATVRPDERPEPFLLPIGLAGTSRRLDVLRLDPIDPDNAPVSPRPIP